MIELEQLEFVVPIEVIELPSLLTLQKLQTLPALRLMAEVQQ